MPDAVPGELVAGVAAHPTGRIEYVVALVPSTRVSLAKKKTRKMVFENVAHNLKICTFIKYFVVFFFVPFFP